MKKVCLLALCAALISGTTMLVKVQRADARPPYKAQFDAKYVKKDSSDPAEKKLAEAAEAAKCNICHVGKEKKERNTYGKALAKLLTKADVGDAAKIQAALDTVAKEKSDPANASSPTFGDQIKEGKLPGT